MVCRMQDCSEWAALVVLGVVVLDDGMTVVAVRAGHELAMCCC